MNEDKAESKKRRKVVLRSIGILLVTGSILCGVVLAAMIQETKKTGNILPSLQSSPKDGKLQMLYVTHISTGGTARTQEEKINWWFNSLDEKYYLFLPSSANMRELRLGLEGIGHIYIDGEKVKNQEKFSVSKGEHQVTTDADKTGYPLIIIKSSGVGTLYVNTESGSMDFVHAQKGNEEAGSTLIMDETGKPAYLGKLDSIKGRGNSWDLEKHSYQIKLSKKTDLFKMGKAKNWILTANFEDPTLFRNHLIYEIAQKAGLPYTTDNRFMDLYVNGDYRGTYLLCEKVEVNSQRINISNLEKQTQDANTEILLEDFQTFGSTEGLTEMLPNTAKGFEISNNPEDITGGYLLEIDTEGRYLGSLSGFVTAREQAVVLKEPQYASREQMAFIWNRYQEFEDAIYDENGINPNTGLHYSDYIDMDSFAKKYLVEEITKNLDATMSSQFLYKYPDDISTKLYAGPPWDYDRAFGNFPEIYGFNFGDPNGLAAMQPITTGNIWYALYEKPDFYQAVLDYYHKIFRPLIMWELEEKIDADTNLLIDSVLMNKLRWQTHGLVEQDILRQNYRNDMETLKQFLQQRILFLDKEWKSQ